MIEVTCFFVILPHLQLREWSIKAPVQGPFSPNKSTSGDSDYKGYSEYREFLPPRSRAAVVLPTQYLLPDPIDGGGPRARTTFFYDHHFELKAIWKLKQPTQSSYKVHRSEWVSGSTGSYRPR